MTLVFTGDHRGQGRHFVVLVSRFSKVRKGGRGIGDLLLEGCVARLTKSGVDPKDIAVVWVPGAFELPTAARAVLASWKPIRPIHAVIALGCVIRGETPHFEHVAGEAARGLARLGAESGVPVIFGVLTCDTDEQALARCGGDRGHKGADAADAALEMAGVLERVREWKPNAKS